MADAVIPLVCSTIHLAGPSSSAIVAGTTMAVGDTIRGYTLKQIDEEGVLLVDGTEFLFLPLRREKPNQTGVWIAYDRD